MLYLLALAAALDAPAGAASAVPRASVTPAPSASPSAIATARPHVRARTGDGPALPAVPAVEPGFRAPQTALPSSDIAGNDGPFVGLSLDSAIGMALSRNTDLGVSQADRRIAGYRIVAAEGAYDVRLQIQPTYQFAQSPSQSTFQAGPGGTQITGTALGIGAGVAGLTRGGGRFSATTSAARAGNNVSSSSYDPIYQTALGIAYTQPLARGRGVDEPRRQIQLAKINADLSDDAALLAASNTVDATLVAYYNLVAAWKNVAIQEDALRQARAQSASNARLVRGGVAAPVDVIESDTQVNAFQDNVYSAIANVASLQNSLKALLLSDPGDPMWTANLVPTSPLTSFVAEPAVNDIVLAALRTRPEVARLRESIRAQNVNTAYAREQRKPQFDVTLGVTENGFAGTPAGSNRNPFAGIIAAQITAINQLIARANAAAAPGTAPLVPLTGGIGGPLFPGSSGGLGASYKSLFQGRYPQYTLAATIALPLRNRTANAEYAAEVERRRALAVQEVGLIQRLQLEARNAVQGYRSARSRLVAASAARTAAEQVAASESRKFRAGQSTTFLVLQRQVALANQRGRELQAQSDVQKAVVELDRVTGTILANNHVDVRTVGTGPLGTTPDLLGSQ
ncbi:MAG: hypothetical protein NVSMB19_16710 [Vulcanimicrobiaceae bacterium]